MLGKARDIRFRIWDGEELGEASYMKLPTQSNELIKIMQYTGLKDKNGKEIYEGDILKVPDLYETPENTSTTYHNEAVDFEGCSFRLGGYPITDDAEYVSDECEIIGNIYEHPHLLKEASQ